MKGKIKVMRMRPNLTDEEIREHMDFDGLLEKYAASPKPKWEGYGLSAFIALVAIMGGLWLYLDRASETPQAPEKIAAPLPALVDSSANLPAGGMATTDNQKIPTEVVKPPVTPSVGKFEVTKPEETKVRVDDPLAEVSDAEQEVDDSVQARSGETPLTGIYVQSEPVDGFPDLYAYFGRELSYPEVADSLEGVVVVVFTINPQGRPEKITIEKSLGLAFDQEAIRLIENMPDWKPATFNHEPVSSRLSIPITFQIQRIKPED